jgi:hypothetical protein
MRAPLSTFVAILAGGLVLLGYFLPIEPLQSVRILLVQWAVILAAFGLLVGVINLGKTHWLKVRNHQPGRAYSLLLLIALILTAVVVLVSGPTGSLSMWAFNNIQLPIESSLAALLAIVLAYTSVRLLYRRPNLFSVVFVITALFVLLGTAPIFLFNEIPELSMLRSTIIQVPALAGTRGILLGVGLGTLATTIRILMGVNRPYGG